MLLPYAGLPFTDRSDPWRVFEDSAGACRGNVLPLYKSFDVREMEHVYVWILPHLELKARREAIPGGPFDLNSTEPERRFYGSGKVHANCSSVNEVLPKNSAAMSCPVMTP